MNKRLLHYYGRKHAYTCRNMCVAVGDRVNYLVLRLDVRLEEGGSGVMATTSSLIESGRSILY